MPCLDNAIAGIPAHLWGRLPYAFALVLSIEILTYAYIIHMDSSLRAYTV